MANVAAAKCGGSVFDAMQTILTEEHLVPSARQFAESQGIDVVNLFRQGSGEEDLEKQVKDVLEGEGSPMGITSAFRTPPATAGPPHPGEHVNRTDLGSATGTTQAFGSATPISVAQAGNSQGSMIGSQMGVSPAFSSARFQPPSTIGSDIPPPAASPVNPPALGVPHQSPAIPTMSSSYSAPVTLPTTELGASSHLSSAATTYSEPAELMQSFNKGMESGAPFSAPGNAVPTSPLSHTESQLSSTPPTAPSAGISSPVHAPAFDSPPPVQHAPVPEAPSPPIVAASLAPNPTQPIPSAAGPLPTYGADLRPAVPTTTPAAPPPSPPPLPATPSSAPVHPAAGQASTNHPPVVRQAPPPTSSTPPSNVGAQAVVATASGAVAGTASADATERARLRKIVITVARQQPRLAWAAGNRADNTTVLATDLASGWIPPGIALPAAVTLLQPARRSGNLEALLGEINIAEAYTPIHHVPDEDEPLATSPRPRQAETIDEFAWELSQATQWRDGLPRLAHTLAKAACAGTGVLDSEIAILREHLATTSAKVLDSYPENIDAHDVGNWQLLAAIDALAAGDKASANYHFAWFQACAR
ncbi:DUF5631 domain-containing protein [Mycobacterium szulgai]|uniref:DUF5631 domain-containing protein n=1 Tax=Mycobacterium szulgai TaxID=1787 RepID=UPI003184348E